MSLTIADDHIIFKVCLKCGFDTLKHANRPRHQGLCFRCPECKSFTFVITCSECTFENSLECPLTQLLDRKLEIRDAGSDDEKPRGQPLQHYWYQKDEDDEKVKCSQSAGTAEEESCEVAGSSVRKGEQQNNDTEQAATLEGASQKYINGGDTEINDTKLEDTEQRGNNENGIRDPGGSVCPHCRQQLCRTCEPGYMSIIADMKEFSTTFAAEIRFCTMCKHGLCPGSELAVFLQCRECGHSACEDCQTKEDRLGEDWRVCCQCEKIAVGRTDDCLGPELSALMYQEGADEDSEVDNQSEGRARVDVNATDCTSFDDVTRASGGQARGFPEWLVGGGKTEGSATGLRPMQRQKSN